MGIPKPIIIFVVLILIVGIYFMTKGKKKPDSNTIASEATGEEAETTTEATEATGEEAETTITKEEEEEEEEEVKKEEGVTIGQLQESIATPPQTDNTPTATEAVVSQEAISAPPSIPGVTVATATADDSVPDVPVPVPASVNCVGGWGDWSACSVACGGGNKSRTYAVTTPASGSGEACIKQNGEVEEISCNSDPCPIDCVGEWGSWGDCSRPCGGGVKTRTYTHTRPAAHGGMACDIADQFQESQECNTQACPVACVGAWGEWGACSQSCGGGMKSRTYAVTTPATGGGQACPANNEQVEETACNTQACPVACVGAWGEWGECSQSCGGGMKSRTYAVTTPASGGGQACPATNGQIEETACNTQPCPINCVGDWGQWGACSASCGGGEQTRTFTQTTPAAHGGTACVAGQNEVGRQACNTQPCPINCVGDWGQWGACSASCGGGEQTRTFTQTTPAAHGGTACVAGQNAVSRQACNTQPCPVNCQGGWGAWSACSRNEQGYQYRNYTVTRPAAHGGSTTTCEKPNNYTEGQFCNSGNPYWQGAPNSGTALNDITAVAIPGPTGANAIPGSLEFMGKWDQYNRNCGSWSNRSCETGVAMYINDEHRATMHRWAKGGGSDITTAWKRISGVNSGDNIKVVETGDRTQNAKMAWIFHPNDTGAHPRSLPDIQP
ncbi:thrombospondin type-1 domain-containing protein 7A isoform X8 [Dishui Lake phycodnavirus 4]|nr:thrombospondin type-1 domain-containing protein 7A isoform X8 [Dishui Lake phycodnavirus 4]